MIFFMEKFLSPLIGGLLIGVSTSIMLGALGKISGISSILGHSLGKPKKDHIWRYLFILGLLFGGVLLKNYSPDLFSYKFSFHYGETILAGLLVGFGTLLGNGCTSGHGVCGLPRLSKRSWVATMTFMGAGILTVIVKGAI
jgi:uncharacterized membrane protein YedE/YeeE